MEILHAAIKIQGKRIGVALGNTLTASAHAHCVIDGTTKRRWDAIEKLIGEWQPLVLVCGIPRHPDGAAHEVTVRASRFARQLAGRFHLPVFTVDERYSSVEAERDNPGPR